MIPNFLQEKISLLPTDPGIYLYKDENDQVIYIGKAKNIKKRVLSYFQKTEQLSAKTKVLIGKIRNIEYVQVKTELDALILENNWIKKYRPRYNILLKDDKTYPWICIKNEAFPRVFSTRQKVKDGSLYFGPYPSGKMMHALLDLIRELYPLRTCNLLLNEVNISKKKFKVCLEYHIGRCKGPCEGLQTAAEYQEMIKEIKEIIKGNFSGILSYFKQKMKENAKNLNFEQAHLIQQKMQSLENYQSKSAVVTSFQHAVDVLAYFSEDGAYVVSFLRIVQSALIQVHTVELQVFEAETEAEILGTALMNLREQFDSDSKEVIVPFEPLCLTENFHFLIPKAGEKKQLLEFAERNIQHFLHEKKLKEIALAGKNKTTLILEQMQKDLQLPKLPKHIECFDNSNLQGTNAVAACVVFRNAKPSKKEYRHFNIKTVEGPDDFASMHEIILRRYKNIAKEEQPDLILIDGGKGQLNAALSALKELNLQDQIPLISIAKRLEEIYQPNDPDPLYLNKKGTTLPILQQLRDEAHRFGITHHRQKRSKMALISELTQISGIGAQNIQLLLQHFSSFEALKTSSLEELEQILKHKIRAKNVWNYFHSG